MKRLRTPDRRQADSGDPDRQSQPGPDANLRDRQVAGVGVRDPRAQGKATRGKDETATRRHLEGAEQGPM